MNQLYYKVSKFAILGFVSYSLTVLLTWFLSSIISIKYYLSYPSVLVFITILNYFANKKIVFRVKTQDWARFIKYIMVVIFFIFINTTFVSIMTELVGYYYLHSVIFVSAFASLLKFILYDRLIFR